MRVWLAAAGVNGLLAVSIGAIVAHLLRGQIDSHALELIDLGARYQMYHALALIGVAWFSTVRISGWVRVAGVGFVAGTICFCGGLYGLALTQFGTFAGLVPIGGIAFIFGWIAIVLAAFRA